MPLALNLGVLYEQVLQRLIPLPARAQENLANLVARVEQAATKEREVENAASKLAKEKQFNRKVEINAHLRQLKTELEQLTR
jgi:alcohol dehydrogenase class IV